jgi:hypothetical protein
MRNGRLVKSTGIQDMVLDQRPPTTLFVLLPGIIIPVHCIMRATSPEKTEGYKCRFQDDQPLQH